MDIRLVLDSLPVDNWLSDIHDMQEQYAISADREGRERESGTLQLHFREKELFGFRMFQHLRHPNP